MDLKNKVPGLFAFNRMAVARKGNVPCNVIMLIGSNKDIDAVLTYEAKFLFDNGVTINEKIVTDIKNANIPQSYFFNDTKNVTFDAGNIYFVKNNSVNVRCNTFDVTGLGGPNNDEIIKAFAEKLGFDNTNEVIKYVTTLCENSRNDAQKAFKIMSDSIASSNDNKVIDTILNNHFMNYEDNICHDVNELSPLKELIEYHHNVHNDERKNTGVTKQPIPESIKLAHISHNDSNNLSESDKKRLDEIKESNEQIKSEVSDDSGSKNRPGMPSFIANVAAEKNDVAKSDKQKIETKSVLESDNQNKNDTTVKHGGAASRLSEFAKKRDADVKQKQKDAEEAEATNFAPKPVTKKTEKQGNVKEKITKAEDEKNKKLLAELTSIYEETMQFIDDTCNSQFRIIRNRMEEALKNKKFRQIYTTMYLDISDDNSTELYKKLYDLDCATAKFYKELTSQVVEMGCAFCGKSWREDITFMEPGPHHIECPHCAAERGFEKEPITE